ncbi:MAG: cyclic pyranopterin monophosphate synthase MoaC, partial [Proteobacteria bacterium]|nr:cyclic pyranopterin monophosphate synthase MoaC [Pseudomonadota bacterium]
MGELSHVDGRGRARMVDVTDKASTVREAVAQARVLMERATFDAVLSGDTAKGPVLSTARIAGIQAAKNTAGLIPMCHPLALTHVS